MPVADLRQANRALALRIAWRESRTPEWYAWFWISIATPSGQWLYSYSLSA